MKGTVDRRLCFSLWVPRLGTHQAHPAMLPPELAVKRKGWKEEKKREAGNDRRRAPFGAEATPGGHLVTRSSVSVRIK